VHHRTLTGLLHLVQDQTIRQAFHPYTMAGAYGHVLDAVAEPLALRPWSCFETDDLFTVPALIAPTLGVLFHQLSTAFQQCVPTYFPLDESWRYLAHLPFREQIEEWLRELRKLHVNLVFSTQDVHELLHSPIATVILNMCPIRFFLPNKHALEPKIAATYREIGLNDRQIELVATAQPHRDYFLMTRDGCRMIDLALGPVQITLLTKGTMG
jgi:type IV secretion system protein VirB4